MESDRLPIITSIPNLDEFKRILETNPGVFIMKLGAEWCGPCKQIAGLVKGLMDQAPPNVQCAIIDVDEAFSLYSFLKTKKVISAIPSILVYHQGNVHYVPDDGVVGADPKKIMNLFVRSCSNVV